MTSADLNIHLSEKWPKWLRTGSQELSIAVSPGLLAFLVFELEGGHFGRPPPAMAKVAETATRARVKVIHAPGMAEGMVYGSVLSEPVLRGAPAITLSSSPRAGQSAVIVEFVRKCQCEWLSIPYGTPDILRPHPPVHQLPPSRRPPPSVLPPVWSDSVKHSLRTCCYLPFSSSPAGGGRWHCCRRCTWRMWRSSSARTRWMWRWCPGRAGRPPWSHERPSDRRPGRPWAGYAGPSRRPPQSDFRNEQRNDAATSSNDVAKRGRGGAQRPCPPPLSK